jgi:hypothetical protein
MGKTRKNKSSRSRANELPHLKAQALAKGKGKGKGKGKMRPPKAVREAAAREARAKALKAARRNPAAGMDAAAAAAAADQPAPPAPTCEPLYRASDRVLIVGDGDLSFSLALATMGAAAGGVEPENIDATVFDSREVAAKKYPDLEDNAASLVALGAKVGFGVDATALESYIPGDRGGGGVPATGSVWLGENIHQRERKKNRKNIWEEKNAKMGFFFFFLQGQHCELALLYTFTLTHAQFICFVCFVLHFFFLSFPPANFINRSHTLWCVYDCSPRGHGAVDLDGAPFELEPPYDAVSFHFPHLGEGVKDEERSVISHGRLIAEFLTSARRLGTRDEGRIHVTSAWCQG